MSNTSSNQPEEKNAVRQHAANVSAQVRRQAGHDRRVAAGIPCRRCFICFPETGKRDTRLPTKPDARAAALAQPGPYSEPPKEQTFQDRVLPLAESGTVIEGAAIILGMTVEAFQEKVQEVYGVPWETVLIQSRHKVKAELISSAIRAAKLGDWKPYLALEKQGISLGLAEREESANQGKQPDSIEEIDAELERLNAMERSFQVDREIKGTGVTIHSKDIEL